MDAGDAGDAGDGSCPQAPAPVVYGDSAYGSSGQFLDALAVAGVESKCKTQPPTAAGGMFTKDQFVVDLDADTVTCPNQATAPIRRDKHGDGTASFGSTCADCPLRAPCTNATKGRSIRVGRYEQQLADARAAQKDPAWREDYRGTQPKVERKLGHLMHRKHGGRRARMIGQPKIDADFNLLATAHNLARLAVENARIPVHTQRLGDPHTLTRPQGAPPGGTTRPQPPSPTSRSTIDPHRDRQLGAADSLTGRATYPSTHKTDRFTPAT